MPARPLFILGALVALTGAATARPKAEPPREEELLVLGLRAPDGTLSTWVAGAEGLKRAGRGIAVPRQDGWWKLDRLDRKQKTLEEKRLTAARAGQQQAMPPLDVEEGCDTATEETLLFAGPVLYSFELSASGDCEGAAHGFASVQLRSSPYEDATRSSERKVETLFGAEAAKAWEQAARRAHGGEAKRQEDCFADAEPADVGLVRQKGRWVLRGELGYGAEACRGNHEYFTIDTPVAEKLTGPDRLPRGWEALVEARPALVDAVASPSGRLALFVDPRGLELVDGDKPVVRLEEPGMAIVLAQWAVGRNAARWRTEVVKTLSR